MELILYLGGGAGALLTIGTLAWRLGAGLRRGVRRLSIFLEDWAGEEARPGVPARPGVMQRLGGIETQISDVQQRLEAVEHEVHPNNGRSIKDAIGRTERKIDETMLGLAELTERFDQHLAEHAAGSQ